VRRSHQMAGKLGQDTVTARPKFQYVRDTRLRDMCRAMECQCCGLQGPITWAHSNWAEHGHGRGIKASDVYVAALCWMCHRDLDQGSRKTADERRALWDKAHGRTVRTAMERGLWPEGVPVPNVALSGARSLECGVGRLVNEATKG
jgi:hypothetical protein